MKFLHQHQKMDRYRYFCLWYTILGFIFFGRFIRGAFLPSSIASVNITGLLCSTVLVFVGIQIRNWKLNIRDLVFLLLIIVCSFLFFYTELKNHMPLLSQLRCFVGLIVPLLLLHIQFQNKDIFIKFLNRFIKFFNGLVMILLVWALFDYFTNSIIAKTVCAILGNKSLVAAAASGRFTSFLGHPLFNTEIFIFYFAINAIVQKYVTKQKDFKYNIVALMGVLLTASKTGVVLIFIGMILINKSKPKRSILLIITVGILYALGFFDFVIERFISGSLTSNRSEKWLEVISWRNIDFHWLYGFGGGSVFSLNESVSHASAAFEYPIRLIAYEFGLLFTIIISSILFIYPAWIFIRKKQYILFIGFLVFMVDVNTYNGLGLYHDYMYVYCAFLCILLNISRCVEVSNVTSKVGVSD